MEKIKITNNRQFEKLVEELEKNPSLARGFNKGTVPNNINEQWESIATVVNSLGPPIRSGAGWQKIWRDRKFKVKRKLAINKAESIATGGGVFKQQILSPLDEAVANFMQFGKQINPEGMVQGVPNIEDSGDVYLLELLESETAPTIGSKAAAPSTSSVPSTSTVAVPSTSTSSVPSTAAAPSTSTSSVPSTSTAAAPSTSTSSVPSTSTAAVPSTSTAAVPPTKTTSSPSPLKRMTTSALKKNEIPAKRNELLERHTTDQARILGEISNSITSLKRSLREIKDIEVKRLKYEVERSKREEEKHVAVMKIKRIELTIKEKELQLLK